MSGSDSEYKIDLQAKLDGYNRCKVMHTPPKAESEMEFMSYVAQGPMRKQELENFLMWLAHDLGAVGAPEEMISQVGKNLFESPTGEVDFQKMVAFLKSKRAQVDGVIVGLTDEEFEIAKNDGPSPKSIARELALESEVKSKKARIQVPGEEKGFWHKEGLPEPLDLMASTIYERGQRGKDGYECEKSKVRDALGGQYASNLVEKYRGTWGHWIEEWYFVPGSKCVGLRYPKEVSGKSKEKKR